MPRVFGPIEEMEGVGMRAWMIVLGALSLSLGWGIRGNFGHEYGAMLPGALASMGIVLLLDRPDWWRRVAHFGMFGALGWSFGGSISYMQVISYTHSGHAPSVLYGFACVFVIGFLWAAMGGAGAAIPAVLDRDRLKALYGPMLAVFAAWFVEEIWLEPFLAARGFDLNWYDTDWLGALVAGLTAIVYAAASRRWSFSVSLIVHLCVGWYVVFVGLVVVLGLRMTPPRGDNWAGCLGMVAGLVVFLVRNRLWGILFATVTTGLLGGAGYTTAVMMKLVEVTSGLETNWHSVLEQTQGLFHGLALAIALGVLAKRQPVPRGDEPKGDWTDAVAVVFVWIGITYLNLRKNPMNWVRDGVMPGELYGLSTFAWFDLAYVAMLAGLIVLLARHMRRPIAVVPATWTGTGQLLYLVLLWWMVAGNFERALPGFAAQRLITEGVIHLNAVACSLLLLMACRPARVYEMKPEVDGRFVARAVAMGLAVAVAAILIDFAVVRGIYGDRFAGHAGLHIRFGPNATVEKK